jgi:hypothetical protein
MTLNNELAFRLAQAALRGYFNAPDGFNKLDSANRKRAIESVEKVLSDQTDQVTKFDKNESDWES